MKSKFLLISAIAMVIFNSGCKKDTDDNDHNNQPEDMYIVDVSSESNWDYWVVGEEGDYLMIREQNTLPKTIFFKPENVEEGYPIFMDDSGLPEKAVISGYIFLFGNFDGNTLDISIINPSGEIEVLREIETDVNWNELTLKSAQENEEWSDIIRWSGHVAGGVACGITVAVTVGTAGAGFPLAVLGCGATLVSIATEFLPDDYEILGLTATTVGSFAGVVGCIESAGITCALNITSLAASVTAEAIEEIENNQVIISDVPIRVNLFLTKEEIETLANQGMIINDGLMPPDITGNFYLDNWTNLLSGNIYTNYSYRFFNQTSDLKVDLEYATSSSTATGLSAMISGEESKFSIYSEVNEANEDNGHTVNLRIATIFSGEMDETGIKNFQKGFIIIEKENDINNAFMNVGESRIVFEADSLASRVGSFPYAYGTKIATIQSEDTRK